MSACLLIGRTLSVCQSVACSHYVCLPVGCVYICLCVRVPVCARVRLEKSLRTKFCATKLLFIIIV